MTHPQRCETCNPKCVDYLVVQKQERTFKQDHLKQMERFSALRGCASHSTAATKRDKVLDEAILIVVKSAKEMEGRRLFCTVLELCQKLEELRHKAGEHL